MESTVSDIDTNLDDDARDRTDHGKRHGGNRGNPANVVLVGLTGSGKSTVARQLAYHLGFGRIDLDQWIEDRQKMSVLRIFQDHGEDRFRSLEHQALQDLQGVRNHVVAVGGGAVGTDANWDLIAKLGFIVWLNPPISTIVRRTLQNRQEMVKRPQFAEIDSKADVALVVKHLEALLTSRLQARRLYYDRAGLQICDSVSSPEVIAHQIKSYLRDHDILGIRPDMSPSHTQRRPATSDPEANSGDPSGTVATAVSADDSMTADPRDGGHAEPIAEFVTGESETNR